jgi:hypothetical protein
MNHATETVMKKLPSTSTSRRCLTAAQQTARKHKQNVSRVAMPNGTLLIVH